MNSHYQRWQFVKYGTFTRLPVDFSASAIHCLRKLISLFGWLSVMSLSGGNNCQSSRHKSLNAFLNKLLWLVVYLCNSHVINFIISLAFFVSLMSLITFIRTPVCSEICYNFSIFSTKKKSHKKVKRMDLKKNYYMKY